MRHLIYIFLILRLCSYSQSLNLIPDPSIEQLTVYDCNVNYNFSYLKYWYNPTNSSPDAMIYCDYPLFSTVSLPHSGYGAVLMFIYYPPAAPYESREYIASPLTTSLKANHKYCFDYYTKPVKGSRYGCNSIGAYFGVGHQYYNTGTIPTIVPQSDTLLAIPITDTSIWFHYVDTYIATGGETDIMIGNFKHNNQINTPIIDTSYYLPADGAYFIFDDVSLYEMSLNAGADALTCSKNLVATIGEANSDTAFKSYYWYDASNTLIDSTRAQLTVAPTTNTFYVEEKRMCGQSFFDTVFVNIADLCPEVPVVIPNVFSPNDDGINDAFEFTVQYSQINTFVIYNRWGVKVYDIAELLTTKNSQLTTIQWDGHTTSGEPCSEGVYYYIVEFTNAKQEKETYRGYISLFR